MGMGHREGSDLLRQSRGDDREPKPTFMPRISPGKRTRTMSLPGCPPEMRIAAQPVQRKARPQERDVNTADWMNVVMRPDLYDGPGEEAERRPVKLDGGGKGPKEGVHELAAEGISGSATVLPFLEQIQRSFGAHDVSHIKAHIGGPAARASEGMGANAYAMGDHVAFRAAPDLHTVAHEAVHVVQQRAGVQLEGGVGQAGDAYERQADVVADAVVRGEEVEAMLTAISSTSTNGAVHAGGCPTCGKPSSNGTCESCATDQGNTQSTIPSGHSVQGTSRARTPVQRQAIHTGKILDEGTCEHLACESKWACTDEKDGVDCPSETRNKNTRRRPLFTCDKNCEPAKTCDDEDTWMAIPKDRFAFSKCDQDLVICANGRSIHAHVRDRSDRQAWEVSRGVQSGLGVGPGTFSGTIYGDENDPAFKQDALCGNSKKESETGKKESGTGKKETGRKESGTGRKESGTGKKKK